MKLALRHARLWFQAFTKTDDVQRYSFVGKRYTFTTERSANSIRAKCEDAVGNMTTGPSRVMSVHDAPTSDTSGQADTTDATTWERSVIVAKSPILVKLTSWRRRFYTRCRTVYFLDTTGKRHAFPNEKAYFSWYTDWSGILEVSETTMASFTLGKMSLIIPNEDVEVPKR